MTGFHLNSTLGSYPLRFTKRTFNHCTWVVHLGNSKRQIKKALRFLACPSWWRRDRKLYRVWFGAVGGTRVPGQVKHCGSSDPGHENYRGLQRIFPTNVVFSLDRIWSFRHDPNFFLVQKVTTTDKRPNRFWPVFLERGTNQYCGAKVYL